MKKKYIVIPEDTDPKIFGLFTRRKHFYKVFFSLLIMIALQKLATTMVNLVDNFMLGRYSELALSGATLVNQLQFIMMQLAFGIGMGIVVLASQYWGQGRIEPIKKIISTGLKVGILVGVIFFLLSTFMPEQILGLFTHDTEVIAEGVRYLEIMRWTYLLFAASNSLMYAMQSVETVLVGTLMSLSTICINTCLNSILIYGNFGAPELGIRGAAYATLVSRSVELLIILIYIRFKDKKLRMKLKELFRFDDEFLKDYLKVAFPVIISGLLWGIAQGAQTAVLGHINASVIAANSIATIVFQIVFVFGYANVNVTSIITGRTIGEGNLHLIRSYTKTMQGLLILMGVASGLILFCIKGFVVDFYNVSAETRQLALQFMTVLSITCMGTGYEYPLESGIIAGGGSTKYQAYADNLFMWLFTIPFSALSAYVFHFSPVVTFCFLKADQLIKCIPNGIVCNRYRWVRILTRDGKNISNGESETA